MSDPLDDLTDSLAGSFTSPSSTTSAHPRFAAYYKNRGKLELNQEKRRGEILDRQKSSRFDHVNHARKLALNELDEDDKTEQESMDFEARKNTARREPKPYKDQIMLSEWLVDIPEKLDDDWLMVPCPEGSRSLLVAAKGVTCHYNKSGHMRRQFQSALPGGGRSHSGGYSILDCVFSEAKQTFYALDLICWNKHTLSDSDVDCRFFFLHSNINENENFKQTDAAINRYSIVTLPYCKCEPKAMEGLMKTEFDFKLDGLLFYNRFAHYHAGETPLVGWLKPFMLPEILNIPVPDVYMQGHETQKAQEFIENFNATQGHKHFGKARSQQPDSPPAHSSNRAPTEEIKGDQAAMDLTSKDQ